MKNHYELLAVDNTATKDEIKTAYLEMMKQYHPDVFKGKPSLSQDYSAKINVAYDILRDSEKRISYDKTIFPKTYTQNYTYDINGNRVPVILNNTASVNNTAQVVFEDLPAFSFFQKSKFSENLKHYLSLSPKEKKKIRKNKREDKKLAKKVLRKNAKQFKLDQKIKSKKQKHKKKGFVYIEKSASQIKLEKSKRKLEATIIVLLGLLLVIFGMLTYLNINYK
jgi:DnaJ-class molecular chaperone